jgi:primosomal protein N''
MLLQSQTKGQTQQARATKTRKIHQHIQFTQQRFNYCRRDSHNKIGRQKIYA